MKTNVRRSTAVKMVADVLNNCSMLFRFDIERQPNRTSLVILTDTASVGYNEVHVEGMEKFLRQLQPFLERNADDVEELLEDLYDTEE